MKSCVVEANSVEDYLNRYYKKNLRTPTLVNSYKKELEEFGYIATSHHDNVMGETICWAPNNI
jgi:hypothetical protein